MFGFMLIEKAFDIEVILNIKKCVNKNFNNKYIIFNLYNYFP